MAPVQLPSTLPLYMLRWGYNFPRHSKEYCRRLRWHVVGLRRALAPVPHLSVLQGGSMWAWQTALSS
eukprot:1088725-Pyramimonas_sp.AAC.1